MESVTLSGRDFKTIHNTLCDLRGLVQRMERSMIKVDEFDRIIKEFEMGLKDAYAQDNDAFDGKMDYYRQFQQENGLSAIWSIYELPIHGFLSDHPYEAALAVVYQGCHELIKGATWGDVYRAADGAIFQSGDQHHIFVEGFELVGDELRLTTGS